MNPSITPREIEAVVVDRWRGLVAVSLVLLGLFLGWTIHHSAHPVTCSPCVDVTDAPPEKEAATPTLQDQVGELGATSWFPALVDRVAEEEGFVADTYEDAGGTKALGYGTNLTTGGITNAQQMVCGVVPHPETVTEPQGRCLLETGLAYRWFTLVEDELWFEDLVDVLKAGLLDMAYQVGVAGEERFTNMLSAIRTGDYATAASEVLRSEWYRQTPGRAGELRGILLAQVTS